ncbi:DJ-1/PfpI family protein [Actinomadura macrotermitis]|uniref:Isonitrile hydratase n=1 Tax=Actinomadura macrotermitis TaxID=2585200 RepID=A0A7K0C5K2_9ACTN|nr:DJ-1/PfpI family protein [Actinomadura macrotermitis]MQY08104.1 Isonitrile hydratase [Actinomadura macrotermitis]
MTKTFAFVLYPGLTALDLIGPLQVLGALQDFGLGVEAVTVAADLEPLGTDTSVRLAASHTFAQVPRPDGLIVPGGAAPTFAALADETLLGYVRTAAETAEVVGSVCTGALVLGAAGLLDGRRATTHWTALPMLERLGATPVSERWVRDGRVITAAGVSAGIDMALALAAELAGQDAARLVQLGIEYDPRPPLGPIDWPGVDRAPFEAWMAGEAGKALADRPDLLDRLLPQAG